MSNETLTNGKSGPPKVYLDVCCLQRPFDDQRQERVRLEAEAVRLILRRVEAGQLAWLTSEVVDYEIAQTPDPERALKASLLADCAAAKLVVDNDVTARATQLENLGFGGYDALHLACAESGPVELFFTTDDKLLKRAARHAADLRLRVVNPLAWLEEITAP